MRLTKRNADGIACSALTLEMSTYDIVDKLAKYEDTGLSPEEIKKKTEGVLELYDKLKPYADAEGQGRLVILPCKVGDTCYITQRYSKRIIVAKVSKITSYTHGSDGKEHEWLIHFASQDRGNGCVAGSDFGKTVFLSREAAEAAFKEGRDDGTA